MKAVVFFKEPEVIFPVEILEEQELVHLTNLDEIIAELNKRNSSPYLRITRIYDAIYAHHQYESKLLGTKVLPWRFTSGMGTYIKISTLSSLVRLPSDSNAKLQDIDGLNIHVWQHYLEDLEKRRRWEEAKKVKEVK